MLSSQQDIKSEDDSGITANEDKVTLNTLTNLSKNPFDDCSSDGEITDSETQGHVRTELSKSESTNPFDVPRDNSTSSSNLNALSQSKPLKQSSSHSPIMFKRTDLNFLVHLGFDISMAKNALMTRSKEDAYSHLKEVSALSKVPIWESPLSVRVGMFAEKRYFFVTDIRRELASQRSRRRFWH